MSDGKQSDTKMFPHGDLAPARDPAGSRRFVKEIREADRIGRGVWLAQRFIAVAGAAQHLLSAAAAKGSYFVLVGPEGDFSAQELQMAEASGFLPVNLGPARLRTETAGLAAVHSLNLVNL